MISKTSLSVISVRNIDCSILSIVFRIDLLVNVHSFSSRLMKKNRINGWLLLEMVFFLDFHFFFACYVTINFEKVSACVCCTLFNLVLIKKSSFCFLSKLLPCCTVVCIRYWPILIDNGVLSPHSPQKDVRNTRWTFFLPPFTEFLTKINRQTSTRVSEKFLEIF